MAWITVGLFFFGASELVAQDIYHNIWAVKIPGGLQEAKEVAVKHGFSYDKPVSTINFVFQHLKRSVWNPESEREPEPELQ